MNNSVISHTKWSPSELVLRVRLESSRLPETVLLNHFIAARRIIVLGILVVTVALVVRVVFTDPVLDTNAARIVELETERLQQVSTIVTKRKQELPQTVVGNRREYFTVKR